MSVRIRDHDLRHAAGVGRLSKVAAEWSVADLSDHYHAATECQLGMHDDALAVREHGFLRETEGADEESIAFLASR
jgi:hypothetical protein